MTRSDTLRYLKQSLKYILTDFTVWLSMNHFIVVEKGVARLCGAMDWRLTLLLIVAAVAAIPLTCSLALKFTDSTRASVISSALAMNEFCRWYRQRDWWSGTRCAAAVLFLLLGHINGVYVGAFTILLLIADSVSSGLASSPKFLWKAGTLWMPLVAVATLIGRACWRLLPDIVEMNKE